MKPITLPMAELKPALSGLGKLIRKSGGLPVLKNIKVERTAEGWIALTATDLDENEVAWLSPAPADSAACAQPQHACAQARGSTSTAPRPVPSHPVPSHRITSRHVPSHPVISCHVRTSRNGPGIVHLNII